MRVARASQAMQAVCKGPVRKSQHCSKTEQSKAGARGRRLQLPALSKFHSWRIHEIQPSQLAFLTNPLDQEEGTMDSVSTQAVILGVPKERWRWLNQHKTSNRKKWETSELSTLPECLSGLGRKWSDGGKQGREELSLWQQGEASRVGKVLGKGRALGGDLLWDQDSALVPTATSKGLWPRDCQLITQKIVRAMVSCDLAACLGRDSAPQNSSVSLGRDSRGCHLKLGVIGSRSRQKKWEKTKIQEGGRGRELLPGTLLWGWKSGSTGKGICLTP